jgi:RNA polymerase sigma-70 factor (ECF subfamily)
MDGAQEQILLERIRSGDETGFAVLVKQHADKVMGLAWRLLGQREEAEDLAQEAFLRLHRALPKFRGDSRVSTWLYRTVTHLAIDHMRRERLKRRLFLTRRNEEDVDPIELASDPRDNPARALHSKQAMLRLRQALARLSPRQRAIFTLKHYEGLPLRDIAELLDLEEGTVKSHLHRAVSALRSELAEFHKDRP